MRLLRHSGRMSRETDWTWDVGCGRNLTNRICAAPTHLGPPTSHVPRPLTSYAVACPWIKVFQLILSGGGGNKKAPLVGGRFGFGTRIRRAHRHWNSTSYRTAAGYPEDLWS